jgi:RNA polymerase sigma-70 factor, ECF subfamily
LSPDTDQDRRWLAFEAEAMPHVDRLFRHAMWLERNRAEPEDLVQETLVQALQSFHRFTPGTNCRAWLVSILQFVRSNRQRKQGRTVIDSSLEERAANIVPFVPPVPDHVTDEDMLLALRQIP